MDARHCDSAAAPCLGPFGFGLVDVYSNWAAARVDLVAASRPIALVLITNGLLVRAGGSLAGVALARVFFNDGVSNEGVSHVF